MKHYPRILILLPLFLVFFLSSLKAHIDPELREECYGCCTVTGPQCFTGVGVCSWECRLACPDGYSFPCADLYWVSAVCIYDPFPGDHGNYCEKPSSACDDEFNPYGDMNTACAANGCIDIDMNIRCYGHEGW